MSGGEIVALIAGAVIGGSGLTGLAFYFLKRYIEKRLTASESDEAERKRAKVKRMQIEDELQHAYGRMFFWIHKAIITGTHNGDLERAFEQLNAAEQKKKDLDREIIASIEQE